MYPSTKDNASTTVDEHAGKTIVESVVESVEGIDEPMEDNHPNVPVLFALATYPIVLGLVILAALTFWFLFR